MTREAVGAALLMLGFVVARLVWTGEYLLFVKGSLAVPLGLSVAVLVLLGGVTLLADLRENRRARDADVSAAAPPGADDHDAPGSVDLHGHDHGAAPRMGALLLAPVFVLILVPAAPLGSFAADNGAANRLAESTVYGDLPAAGEDGAVELLLTEVIGRAVLEPASLDGATVRTLGFVAPLDGEAGAYLLSRFAVGCCAVDAAPFQLVVVGVDEVPSEEEWVDATLRFTGEVRGEDADRLPVFEVVRQEVVRQPDVPYIY